MRFDLALPSTIGDCVAGLAEHNGDQVKLVAGGTDLLPALKRGLLRPARVFDLSGIPELRVLATGDDDALHVGAMVRARKIELSARIRRTYLPLAEAASAIGSIQVRNLATLGGNLCTADPTADLTPPIVALDAVAVIAGVDGRRELPMAAFLRGARETALRPGELLTSIVIPAPASGSGGAYLRHPRPTGFLDALVSAAVQMPIERGALVSVASQVTIERGRCTRARVVVGAVAPTPVRAVLAEACLVGEMVTSTLLDEAAALAVRATEPVSDQRASAEYRCHLVRVLTRRALQAATERAMTQATHRNEEQPRLPS